MNKRTNLCMLAAVAVAAGIPFWAQGQPQGAGKAAQLFQQADADHDGKVTLAEARTVLPGLTPDRFQQLDKNGDGMLTPEDKAAGGGAGRGGGIREKLTRLKAADTNGDQQVSFDEAKAAFPKITRERFDKFDKNGDGALTRGDMQQAVAAKFKEADTNGDGKVSFEEAKAAFPRATEKVFKRFDHNGDNFLSAEDRNQ